MDVVSMCLFLFASILVQTKSFWHPCLSVCPTVFLSVFRVSAVGRLTFPSFPANWFVSFNQNKTNKNIISNDGSAERFIAVLFKYGHFSLTSARLSLKRHYPLPYSFSEQFQSSFYFRICHWNLFIWLLGNKKIKIKLLMHFKVNDVNSLRIARGRLNQSIHLNESNYHSVSMRKNRFAKNKKLDELIN